VLAFDDFPWAAHFRPQMTAVAQPVFELGRQAMRMLLAAMEPESPEAADLREPLLTLKAELRVRQSTAPPPSP
jgi:LacI family transcriptional regulator